MLEWDPKSANVRYHLLKQDHSTLYRKFSRKNGIDVRRASQYNIHDWLDPNSMKFSPQLNRAVFHYAPRLKKEDRLELCISTEEMDEAAWSYGHNNQILFDGTFGVCSSRILLFIAMAIDDDRKGIPLAFFIFSAKSGAQATHSSYSTEILQKLVLLWRQHLERKKNSVFVPFVVITDNDTRERSAFSSIWPGITLLLCKFHLRQSWRNFSVKVMGGNKTAGKDLDFWPGHVYKRLKDLENR